jgi:hypothetical protein
MKKKKQVKKEFDGDYSKLCDDIISSLINNEVSLSYLEGFNEGYNQGYNAACIKLKKLNPNAIIFSEVINWEKYLT